MKDEIREEVSEIWRILGITHTRLNNLVNQIRGKGNQGKPKEITMVEFSSLVQANNDLSTAYESLEYALDPDL